MEGKLILNLDKTNYVIYIKRFDNELGKAMGGKIKGPFTIKENAIKELNELRKNSNGVSYYLVEYKVKGKELDD